VELIPAGCTVPNPCATDRYNIGRSVEDVWVIPPSSAFYGVDYAAPQGTIRIDEHNHHTYLHPRIGRVNAAGQFDIVEQVERTVRPDPYLVSHSLQDWSARSRLTDQA